MANQEDLPAAAIAADPSKGNVMRISKAEEGSAKGEFWAVLRAVVFLVGGILLLGYIIA